jgi:hypothetical protein
MTMARQTETITPETSVLTFSNGTQLDVSPFAGTVTQFTPAPGGLREMLPAELDTSARFRAALDELGILEQETLHLDVARSSETGLRAFQSDATADDTIVLRPAVAFGEEAGVRVVLYQDESSGLSWHFPDGFFTQEQADSADVSTGGNQIGWRAPGSAPTFTIPIRTEAAQSALQNQTGTAQMRGPITKLGRKIFKVLVMPVAAHLLAGPIESIVGVVERKYRQELIRYLTPENYIQQTDTPFTDWNALDGKRALLVIHGIFSSCDGMLGMLPLQAMQALSASYEGRVLALNHLTVSKTPEENAREFLQAVKQALPNGQFTFDILCHSRGGVVARALVEQGKTLAPDHNCRFPKVYFAGSPNQGSPLADPEHMVDMLDVFTNLLTNFPDGPSLYAIELFLALIKLLAYTAETYVPGAAAMGTKDYIVKVLNANPERSPAEYACVAANYDPDPTRDNGFLTGPFVHSLIERIFDRNDNDLVVPQQGVFAANGHPSFPIQNRLEYSSGDHVWHTAYFAHEPTIRHLKAFFSVPTAQENIAPPSDGGGENEGGANESSDQANRFRGITVSRDNVEYERDPGRAVEFGAPGRGIDEIQEDIFQSVDSSERFTSTRGGLRQYSPDSDGVAGGGLREFTPEPEGNEGATREAKTGSAAASPVEQPPGAQPIEAISLRRDPYIDFHEVVYEGAPNELTVRLEEVFAQSGQDAAQQLEIALAAGQENVTLTLFLGASGFDVAPSFMQQMAICRQRDPEKEKATFTLTARNPGAQPQMREIRAEFYLGNSCIGSVTHATCVIPAGYLGNYTAGGQLTQQPVALPRVRRQDCDLVIRIEGRDNSGQAPFRMSMRSELPDDAYDGKYVGDLSVPGNDLATYLNSFYTAQFQKYPNSKAMTAEQFDQAQQIWQQKFMLALRDWGKQLWTLLPQMFRDEYFRLYQSSNPPSSILINSDEMILPWELLIPYATIGGKLVELKPLGQEHILGRWKPALSNKPVPQRMTVRRFCVVNPIYSGQNRLPWSEEEVKRLRAQFPNISVVDPVDSLTIRSQLLERSDVQILHFSGHGDYGAGNPDLSRLYLADGDTLDAYAFTGSKLAAEASPLIYLNACSVGRPGPAVGRMGGFAANCLTGGCSGVIAPYWPINDARAMEFSLALYAKMDRGRAVGEALQELRVEHADDPTYAAFAYFGDPWTRTTFAL